MGKFNNITNRSRIISLIAVTSVLFFYQNCSKPFNAKDQAFINELGQSSSSVPGSGSSNTVNRTLAWDPSVDANNSVDFSVTSYNVYVGTSPGVYNTRFSAPAGTMPSQLLSNLVVGQTYYIAVSAVNVGGESTYSSVLTYVAQ